jgi:hypothetical protein
MSRKFLSIVLATAAASFVGAAGARAGYITYDQPRETEPAQLRRTRRSPRTVAAIC